jgi:Flagellar basal body protein
MSLIENSHTKLLARAMDVYAMRQKITSANVANIDTPGYKKLSVKFEEFLRRLQDGEDLSNVAPEVVQTDQAPILEDEMLEMADTQIRVQMTVRALRTEYEILRSSITENSV